MLRHAQESLENQARRLRRAVIEMTTAAGSGHPTPRVPWVHAATGSLGQGLCVAVGMALANRLDRLDARVYCLMGDGECAEGSVWEAAQCAALNGLDKLVAIVDLNALGQSGPTPYGHNSAILAGRFRAFGWKTFEIDGHHIADLDRAMDFGVDGIPTAIIASTIKGKGVPFLEGAEGWHGKPLDGAQCRSALAHIGPVQDAMPVAPRRAQHLPGARHRNHARQEPLPAYALGTQAASRDAFGAALRALGAADERIVVVDGDVKNSTRTGEFAAAVPERFFEGYIAEQNMLGMALGFAGRGRIPVVATFACFLTRAFDFIRMIGHSQPAHVVICGSHSGISIGEDGPSQMGLEDIAMFRAVHGASILCPGDATSTVQLTRTAIEAPGIVYLRTARPSQPVIYGAAEQFTLGGSKTLRHSASDQVTLVAAGITLTEALDAHAELARRGIAARVIDAYSIRPLDTATLQQAARDTGHVVVVEDHWVDGGLGDAVLEAVGPLAPVQKLGVAREPRSGEWRELLLHYGIASQCIVDAVTDILGVQASGAQARAAH